MPSAAAARIESPAEREETGTTSPSAVCTVAELGKHGSPVPVPMGGEGDGEGEADGGGGEGEADGGGGEGGGNKGGDGETLLVFLVMTCGSYKKALSRSVDVMSKSDLGAHT